MLKKCIAESWCGLRFSSMFISLHWGERRVQGYANKKIFKEHFHWCGDWITHRAFNMVTRWLLNLHWILFCLQTFSDFLSLNYVMWCFVLVYHQRFRRKKLKFGPVMWLKKIGKSFMGTNTFPSHCVTQTPANSPKTECQVKWWNLKPGDIAIA